MDRVRVAAHAKFNLFLHVLAREESGFHSIETLFSLLELHDELIIERTDGGIQINVQGADTGPEEQNLAFRAADMILEATGRKFGVNIQLLKSIPIQAGLGGGSSDGAATLHGVNMLADNVLPEKELLQFATELGSDVPFFASRAACALGWGRGERLLEVPGPPSAPALIVQPGFGVSTSDAYEALSELRAKRKTGQARVIAGDSLADWYKICSLSANDFEEILGDRTPGIRNVFSNLEATRPILTRLCGSGSAMISVYETEDDRDAADVSCSDAKFVIPTRVRAETAPTPIPE